MASEKPKIRHNVEFCDNMSLPVRSAITANFGNAVHHQHRGLGQLRVTRAKKLATGAFQQVFFIEAGREVSHGHTFLNRVLSPLTLGETCMQGSCFKQFGTLPCGFQLIIAVFTLYIDL
jgi:hypothetical protein